MSVIVVLLKHYKGLNPKEIAGFPKDIADKMVELGIAKYHNKDNHEEEEHEDTKSTPEAKTMMDVENLMVGKIEDIKKELNIETSEGGHVYNGKYIEEALDFESLNKGRDGMMEFLMEEMEKRNVPAE